MRLGVNAAILKYDWMHHACTENRHPAILAPWPRYVHRNRRLCERVIPWPKSRARRGAEQALCEFVEDPL